MKIIYFFLFLLLFLPIVYAFNLNQPINVLIKLQNDNGTDVSDVNQQVCIGTVYFQGNNSVIVRDAPLVNTSNFHSFNFTPIVLGRYTVSVQCIYSSDIAIFHQDVVVDVPTAPVGGGYAVLNNEIKTDFDSYTINLQDDTLLSFKILYFIGSIPSFANQQNYRIVRDSNILKQDSLHSLGTGQYEFIMDFKDYTVGDYKILLVFDGKTKFLDLHIVNIPKQVSFFTGLVTGVDGGFDNVRLGWISFCIVVLLLIIYFILRRRRKNNQKNR